VSSGIEQTEWQFVERIRETFPTRFTPDNRFLLFQSKEHQHGDDAQECLLFWDLETKRVRGTIPADVQNLAFDAENRIFSFSRLTDKNDNTSIQIWKFDGREGLPAFASEYIVPSTLVAISPRLDRFASVERLGGAENGFSQVMLRDMTTGRPLSTSRSPTVIDGSLDLRFSSNAKKLILCIGDASGAAKQDGQNQIITWDIHDSNELGNPRILQADSVLSSNGRWCVVPCNDGITVSELGPSRPSDVLQVNVHTSGNTIKLKDLLRQDHDSIMFSPDNNTICVSEQVSSQTKLVAWNQCPDAVSSLLPGGQRHLTRLWRIEDGRQLAAFQDCQDVVFSSDGRLLAVLQNDNTIRIWDIPPSRPTVAAFVVSLTTTIFLVLVMFCGSRLRVFSRIREQSLVRGASEVGRSVIGSLPSVVGPTLKDEAS
jgi:WD40 repeat protein